MVYASDLSEYFISTSSGFYTILFITRFYGINNVAFAPLEQKEAFRGLRLTKMGNQDMR